MKSGLKQNREQLEELKRVLEGQRLSKEHPLYEKALNFISNFLTGVDELGRQELITLMCQVFSIDRAELLGSIPQPPSFTFDPYKAEKELYRILPDSGYFAMFDRYTNQSESPLAFHIGSALVTVAATVNRRVFMDMGVYKTFCNMGVLIIGPSGGVRKTVGADIAVNLLQELELTKVYSEKLTPEALVESMRSMSQGLVYAPELAVFLGKQRYMDGMVPLLTRLLDCPDVWSVETISRSKTILSEVGISTLMCSTPDWMVTAASEDLFKGGFFARHLAIIQEASCRCFPRPTITDRTLKQKLLYNLARLHEFQGPMVMDQECGQLHDDWYRSEKHKWTHPENDVMGAYYNRKQSHVLKIAMNLHLGTHENLTLCEGCMQRAIRLVDWFEQFLPPLLKRMFKTQIGLEQELIVRAIQSVGGKIDHSALLHKVSHRMYAGQMRTLLASLQEAGVVREVKEGLEHYYTLVGE